MVGLQSKYRTHTCGELRPAQVGETVRLSGWIMRMRDHGGVVFVDLRDHYGITQVVFAGERRDIIQSVRIESVITVIGTVKARAAELVNSKLATGEIEVHTDHFEVQSVSDVLPFQIADDDHAPEALRLRYRFLDLRREDLHRKVMLRTRIIREIRKIMEDLHFTEFNTPILTSSSPEGARDFLVPSRFHPGRFFALPQAPQQFKQLLMIAGFDRYFQIAPCFRDEDPRADRSPGEFYQLDLEMSFVEQDDVLQVGEIALSQLFTRLSDWEVTPVPFPRLPYRDAFAWYGTDKPDLRIPHKIQNLTETFRNSEFKVFSGAVAQGGDVVALVFDLAETPPRKYFDDTIEWFKKQSGLGLSYVVFEGESHKGTIAKFLNEGEIAALRQLRKGDATTIVWFGAGPAARVLPGFGKLRVKLAKDFNQIEDRAFRFCYIVDFPMYERDEKTGNIVFSHNPFSMPQGGLEALNTKDPLDILAYQYDIVCNGYELSSGAIRNHLPEIMYRAFDIAGYSKEDVDTKFGGMIRAFRYGAPPHGGMAPGIDRMAMLLAHDEHLRDVIAFPMAQTVEDLLMGAPSEVSEQQLRDVHIRVVMPEVKKDPAA